MRIHNNIGIHKREKKLTHGEKVIQFDSLDGTVSQFNDLFTENRLTGYNENSIVEIGQVLHTGHCILREVFIDSRKINHRFGYLAEDDIKLDLYKKSGKMRPKIRIGNEVFKDNIEASLFYDVDVSTINAALQNDTFRGLKISRIEV